MPWTQEERREYNRTWRQNNKETNKALKAKYYVEHKEQIQANVLQKHDCTICGGKFTTGNKARHIKSINHQRAIQAIEIEKEIEK